MLLNLFNSKDEVIHRYNNAKIVKNDIEEPIRGSSFYVIENYNKIKGDVGIIINEVHYHASKSSMEKKNKTVKGYNYRYYRCITNNGNEIMIQIFLDKNQGVVVHLNSESYLHIY